MRPLRHAILPLIIALLILPAAAYAVDCGPNCLGLYFEPTADTWCGQVAAFTQVPLYLVVTDPSMAEVSGIAFYVDLDGPIQLLGVTFGSPIICDTFTPDAYCGVWDPPLATTPATVLAMLTVMVTDASTPAFVILRGFNPPEGEQVWVTLPGDQQAPLYFSTGVGMPLVQINGECGIVPTESSAWGSLKSLYR